MDPNYEWRFEKGSPVALTGAFGIKLSSEINFKRLSEITEKLGDASSNFIEEVTKSNAELQKAFPMEASELQYAKAFVYYQIHLHQQATGERVTFVEQGRIAASWERQGKTNDSFEGLDEAEKNRALVIKSCEDFVLNMSALETETSRKELKITPRQLYEACQGKLPWFGANDNDEERVKTFQLLLEILMEDGWVVFNNPEGQSNVLPYGEGVPHYDADLGVEHPIWDSLASI